MIHHFKRATRLLIFWSLIAIAVGMTATRIFLEVVENYKSELEQTIRDITDIQLDIGSLSAGTRGFNPEIILRDIDILSVDEEGQPAVTLQELRLGIDMWQLLMSGELLSSTRLSLVGAKVVVLRHEDGSFGIKGLAAGDNERPLWLARAGKYEILQSEIGWLDQQSPAETPAFRNLNLLIENDNGTHVVNLLSDLPGKYGDSLKVLARIDGDLLAVDHLSGTVYLAGRDIRFAELLFGDRFHGIKLNSGHGDFELWSDWRDSRPVHVSVDIHGQDIGLQREDGQELTLNSLSALLSWSSGNRGWRLGISELRVDALGTRWPVAEFHLSRRQDTFAAWVPVMNLRELTGLAPFFLSAEQLAQLPKDLAMDGAIDDFALWVRDDREHFAVNGSFNDLTLKTDGALPQVTGFSGRVRGHSGQGELLLDSETGSIYFPDLFRDSIALGRMAGKIAWHQDQRAWHLRSDYLLASNADLETVSRMTVDLPKNQRPIQMEMRTAFQVRGDVSRVPRYLPAKIMDAEVVDWLDRAFVDGRVRDGEFVLSGRLDEFPFEQGQGKFEVMFEVDDGILNYHPDWPRLNRLDANVHFFANNLRIDLREGEAEHILLRRAAVDIPNLSDADYLLVKGSVSGRIDDGLRFMQQTPLHATVDGLLANADIEGNSEVALDLKIPFNEAVQEKVDGVAQVKQARMHVKPVALPVNNLTGELHFTERGIYCERMDGEVLGFPARARIETADDAVRIEIEGKSSVPQLQQQFVFLRNDFARGEFFYSTQLDLPLAEEQAPVLHIQTDTEGVTVDLPEPLGKTAEERQPLRIDMDLPQAGHLPVTIDYGDELKLDLRIDRETESLYAGHILFGQGTASSPDKPGLRFELDKPSFDAAVWSDWLSRVEFQPRTEGSRLDEVLVDIDELNWDGRPLGLLQLDIARVDQFWQGTLNSFPARGSLRIPVDSAAGAKSSLRMTYLDLSKLGELNLPVSLLNSEHVPLIEIISERLLWRGADLGRLELETERRAHGVHFNKVRIRGGASLIDMTADWFRAGGEEMTQLKGRLNSDDFGKFLGKLGYNDDLWETAAAIDFSGYWHAAPYQYSLDDFMGEVNLVLRDGRISSIEPGFGRLLGLIAMEQWAKRFSFDFSDVYQQGLAFNRITGTLIIREGKAYTDDLLVDAVPARVKISGVADLQKKTLSHSVLVVPKSSDAVPIAGTIVGGIASIVTQVFTDDYKEGYFFGSEYKLEGNWDNLDITPLHDRDGLLKKTWDELTDFPWLQPDTD